MPTDSTYRYDGPKDPRYPYDYYPVLDSNTVRRNLRIGDMVNLTVSQFDRLTAYINLTIVTDPDNPPPPSPVASMDSVFTDGASLYDAHGNVIAVAGGSGGAGAPGTSFRVGHGAPSNVTGINGDTYLDLDTDNLYGPKASGVWGATVGNIHGLVGSTGATGATGTAGIPGVAGAAGHSLLSGHGVPAAGTGSNGDSYLNLDTGDLYGPKAAGAWGGVQGNLHGAVGATGATGAAGAAGQEGATGEAGLPGTAIWSATRIRNDWTNPRAAVATGLTAVFNAGSNPTNSSSGIAAGDPDLGNYFFTKADYAGQGVFQEIQWGWAAAAGSVLPGVAGVQQIVFFRATAKIISGPPGDMTLSLWGITQNSDGTNSRAKKIASRVVHPGDVITLEGFDIANAGAQRAGAMFSLDGPAGAPANTMEYRASKFQIVSDPETECPEYCDGTVIRCSWDGAADASTSSGFTKPIDHAQAFDEWGFSGNAQYGYLSKNGGERPLLSPLQEAALSAEMGVTMTRLGTTVTGAWPSGQSSPNWRASQQKWLADYFDALRERSIKACPILGVPSDWMTTDNVEGSLRTLNPVNYDAFAELTISMIDEWPDVITAVEFFNEPNFTSVWGATPDPALYTQHFIAWATRVKTAHPEVIIVAPAVSRYMGSDNTVGVGLDTFLTGFYNAGGGPHADVISLHPYSWDPSTADSTGATAGYTWSFDTILRTARGIMAANGDVAKPFWITENGGSTDNGGMWASERRNAQYNMLCRTIAAHRGDVKGYFTHTFVNSLTQITNPATGMGFSQIEPRTGRRRLTWYGMARGKMPDADWITLPMQNSWVAFAYGKPGLSYKKEPNGDIHVRAQIKSGTAANAVIGVLPEKPVEGGTLYGLGIGATGTTPAYAGALVQINADGTLWCPSGGSMTLTVLDFTYTPKS